MTADLYTITQVAPDVSLALGAAILVGLYAGFMMIRHALTHDD